MVHLWHRRGYDRKLENRSAIGWLLGGFLLGPLGLLIVGFMSPNKESDGEAEGQENGGVQATDWWSKEKPQKANGRMPAPTNTGIAATSFLILLAG